MELARLPISASQRGKLISAGYTSLSSLSSLSPSTLAHDLKISDYEALEILRAVSQGSRLDKPDGSHAIVNGALTAWDMLHEEESLKCITTSCADLDDILGGGIKCKEVTEIGGVLGIGKTQLGSAVWADTSRHMVSVLNKGCTVPAEAILSIGHGDESIEDDSQ